MGAPEDSYRYSNLTIALTAASPLRDYIEATFSLRRDMQYGDRARCPEIQAEGSGAAAGTIGTTFDILLKLPYDPLGVPGTALSGAVRLGAVLDAEVLEHVNAVRDIYVADPQPELRRRVAWVYALCTEAFRSPYFSEVFATALTTPGCTAERLLALAPAAALADLAQLEELATTHLEPHLVAPVEVGPTFKASQLCRADADFISAGTLLEVKATLGAAYRGKRRLSLTKDVINQLLAYMLFDTDDEYGIDTIALYSARYGYYVAWPLAELLAQLAGRDVDLAEERLRVWELLGGD
jgi:hypothetical protein